MLLFAYILIQRPHTVRIVLLAREPNDVAVVVNVLALLLEHKTFKEFGEDAVGRQELDRTAVFGGGQYFGHEVGRDFLGLGGQHAKGKFAQFRGGVVEQQFGKDHARTEIVDLNFSGSFPFGVALDALVQFLDCSSITMRGEASWTGMGCE